MSVKSMNQNFPDMNSEVQPESFVSDPKLSAKMSTVWNILLKGQNIYMKETINHSNERLDNSSSGKTILITFQWTDSTKQFE